MPVLDDGPASAVGAWRRGVAALGRGEFAAAVLWLERAARLAPNDPRVVLDLANARMGLRGAEALAAAAFAGLVARYDVVPAWLGLLSARRLLGDHAGAAAALSGLLARHCVPDDPAFEPVAAMVAAAAGFDGWSGMLPDGSVRVVGAGALGPPFDLAAMGRVEGVVSVVDDGLAGWASRPAAPSVPPALTLTDSAGREAAIHFGAELPPDEAAPFARRHGFVVPAGRLRGWAPPFRVAGADGADLFGSPVDPGAEAGIERRPASFRGPPIEILPARAPLAVVMPVFRDGPGVQAALESLFAAWPGGRIVAVEDASPEPDLVAWLQAAAEAGRIILRRHPRNLGFPAAVNTGIAAAPAHDVLLLNSDTLVPPGAIEALVDALYAAPDIGSTTPFSNEATILSYPSPAGKNPMPDLESAGVLQNLAAQAATGELLEIPTGVGFCMLIRHDCLAAVGPFRAGVFAQGYGEENDFSLRARHLGFRHVAAAGAYVAHRGGASFGAAGRALNARNAAILNRLHPGYDALIAAFIKADPLAAARRRLDLARLAAGRLKAGAALLISHDHGGGVARIVAREMRALREAGLRPLLLTPRFPESPKTTPFPWDAMLTDGEPGAYPNLTFKLPAQLPALLDLLRAERVSQVALHHTLGHHPSVRGIAAALGVPQDIFLHDYASFCPRVTLLTATAKGEPPRYCGEPNLEGCAACVARLGDETHEGIAPAALVARSARELSAARRVIAPSPDAARRITRHFPKIRPEVTPWEDDAAEFALQPPRAGGARRIVVIGGIGPAKGYGVLMDCARDAVARRLNLEFFVAGHSAEDAALLETGRIFLTGPYQEGEATALIRSLRADLSFLPSIWPETWCFALSEAWRAGLYAIAFDLGAQAARIKPTGRGAVLPLGLPVPRINDALLTWRPDPA